MRIAQLLNLDYNVCGLLLFAAWASASAQPAFRDDFEDFASWSVIASEGTRASISPTKGTRGKGLRLDFEFTTGAGFCVIRRPVELVLSDNYRFTFNLFGEAPRNNLEFKLVDPSGENVWWVNRREFEFAGPWRKVTFRKRHVTFAWGPAGGGEIRKVGAVEFAITAGEGGKGTIWIDDLTITPREPVRPYDATPVITSARHTRTIDFPRNREYGGIIVDWRAPGRNRDYDVQVSVDGRTWQTVREVRD